MRSVTLLSLAVLALIITLGFVIDESYASIGTITVTVKDFHGNPVAGAKVELYNGTTYSETTDSNGVASFANMNTTALYNLAVSFLGVKVNETLNWNYSKSGGTIITEVFRPKICVKSYNRVDVIAGANVKVTSTSTNPNTYILTKTGSDGCVVLQQLPNTSYTVNVNYTSLSVTESTSETFTLNKNTYQREYILNLYRLVIKLRDKDNKIVQQAEVRLWRGNELGDPHLKSNSDSKGEVLFRLLPSGSYTLVVFYKGDRVYSSGDSAISINNNLNQSITLNLKSLTVTVKSLTGELVTGYKLVGKLMAGSSVYAESTTTTGIIEMGQVYLERTYVLRIFFEGQEVYSDLVSEIGSIEVRAKFGSFSVKISEEGLFGTLANVIPKSKLRLEVGNFQVEKEINSEGYVSFTNHPLVEYDYQVLFDSDVIGSGKIHPEQHQQLLKAYLTLKSLTVRLLTLDDRVASSAELKLSTKALGSVGAVTVRDGEVTIDGLLPLDYYYAVTYLGVKVAEGNVNKDSLDEPLSIRAAIGDVTVKAMNYRGDKPLVNSVIWLRVGEYQKSAKTDEEGKAVLKDVPLSISQVEIFFKGLKVYENIYTLSPSNRYLLIEGTSVFKVLLRVFDGEGEPLKSGNVEITVGNMDKTLALNETGTFPLDLIPNGTLYVTVNYLGVEVANVEQLISAEGEEVKVVTNVFTMNVVVYKKGLDGLSPLAGAEVYFEHMGKTVYQAKTDDKGEVAGKLPATDYLITVSYQGTRVAKQTFVHDSTSYVEVESKVYEVKLKLVGIDEKPVANQSVEITREGEVIERVKTDENGEANVFLAVGEYLIRFKRGEDERKFPLRVSDISDKEYVYLPSSLTGNAFLPYSVTAALLAISGYGIFKSFVLKGSKATERQTVSRRQIGERRPPRRRNV